MAVIIRLNEDKYITDAIIIQLSSQWFSPGTPVSSTNKTDCHDITEILLKVGLNTTTPSIVNMETCQ
jgi:hypothetical protein